GPRESAPPTALSVPVVTRLITDLGKAVKAICLYPPSNSICISACERFSGELLGVLKNAGELRLGVVQDAFTYNQEPIKTVAVEDTQLPGLCYECGITDLIFNPSLTVDGIEKLLGILRSVITRSQGDVDLAEALWAESIPGFSFDRVEDLLFTDYESEIRAQYFSQQDPDAKPGLLANAEDEETVYSQMFIGEELTELEDAESESSVVFERVVRTLSDDDPESKGPRDAPAGIRT
ncbi:MAG: hypothetical protein ACE5GA_01830, partial [Candidatus Zixiibacteriota bacterium]